MARFGWLVALVLALASFAAACKEKKQAPPPPTASAPVAVEAKPALEAKTPEPVPGTPVAAKVEPLPPEQVESRDILAREPVTEAAQVKHILLGYAELPSAERLGANAMARTRDEAGHLALELAGRIRNGEPIEPLMAKYSDDPGSAASGDPYPVRPESDFVPEFEALSLRLNRREVGIVRTQFGYHIIQRVQ